MTLKTRRIVSYSFIVSFLIITPILILYGNGYRLDTKKWRIQKTGIIFLTSKQTDVSVYLDDKLQNEKITNENLSLKNLLPGEYMIRAEKEGYTSWQKKLTVTSGQAVFTNDILLMKKSVPANLIPGKIKWINFSQNQKMAAYLLLQNTSEEIWLYDFTTDKTTLLYKIAPLNPAIEASVDWSPGDEKIMLNIKNGNKNNYSIIDAGKPDQIISLADLNQKSFNHLKWSKESSDVIYGTVGNELDRINLQDLKPELLLNLEINPKDTLDDYLIDDDNAYYIRTDKNDSFAIKQKFNDASQTAWRIKIPKSEDYLFAPGNDKYLSIISKKSENLFLIKKDFFENIALGPDNDNLIIKLQAKNALWQPNSDRLLYYNDFEIWVDDLDNNDQKLIVRYSEKIDEALWHPDYAYVIGLIANEIKIFEINELGRNINSLIKLDSTEKIQINSLGEKLYFLSKIGHQEGLFEMDVK